MAFYQNLNRPEGKAEARREPLREPRWSSSHYRSPRASGRPPSTPWLDRLLGSGSSQKWSGRARAEKPAPRKQSRPAVEMVGDPAKSLKPRSKGLIRLVLGLALVGWSVVALQPAVK